MVLPGCAHFPHGLLPLYLYEVRYRLLAQDCLAGDRLFFVANRRDPENDEVSIDNVYPYATAALLQSCRENEDGTFHLALHGLQRIKIVGLETIEPYPKFQIRAMPEEEATSEHRAVGGEILELADQWAQQGIPALAALLERLQTIDDPSITSDVLAGYLLEEVKDQQRYLGALRLEERQRIVSTRLRELSGADRA